ncbi:unnamed protein product [Calypogeia fissa]
MSSFIFTTSIRVRLGLPHPGLLGQPSCVCGHPVDPVGTHILRCSHGSKWTAIHNDIRDVLAAIARDVGPDVGYHVTMEETHVLSTVDGILDQRCADNVFSWAGVRALVDIVVADPIGASMVSLAAHILGHAASHMAQLMHMSCIIAVTYFIPLLPRFLGHFTRPWTGSFDPSRLFVWSGAVTPGLDGYGLS